MRAHRGAGCCAPLRRPGVTLNRRCWSGGQRCQAAERLCTPHCTAAPCMTGVKGLDNVFLELPCMVPPSWQSFGHALAPSVQPHLSVLGIWLQAI